MKELYILLTLFLETASESASDSDIEFLKNKLSEFVADGGKIEINNLKAAFETEHAHLIEEKIKAVEERNFPLAASLRDQYEKLFTDFLNGKNENKANRSMIATKGNGLIYNYLGEEHKQAKLLFEMIDAVIHPQKKAAEKSPEDVEQSRLDVNQSELNAIISKLSQNNDHFLEQVLSVGQIKSLGTEIITGLNKILELEYDESVLRHPKRYEIFDFLEQQYAILSQLGYLFVYEFKPNEFFGKDGISYRKSENSYFEIVENKIIIFYYSQKFRTFSVFAQDILFKFQFQKYEKKYILNKAGIVLPKELSSAKHNGLFVDIDTSEGNHISQKSVSFARVENLDELKADNKLKGYTYRYSIPPDYIFCIGKITMLLVLFGGRQSQMPIEHVRYFYRVFCSFGNHEPKDEVNVSNLETFGESLIFEHGVVRIEEETTAIFLFFFRELYERVAEITHYFKRMITDDDTELLFEYMPSYFNLHIIERFHNKNHSSAFIQDYYVLYFSYKLQTIDLDDAEKYNALKKEFDAVLEKYWTTDFYEAGKYLGAFFYNADSFENAAFFYERAFSNHSTDDLNKNGKDFDEWTMYMDSAAKSSDPITASAVNQILVEFLMRRFDVVDSDNVTVIATLTFLWFQLKMVRLSVLIMIDEINKALAEYDEMVNFKTDYESKVAEVTKKYDTRILKNMPVYVEIDNELTRLQVYHWVIDSFLKKKLPNSQMLDKLDAKYGHVPRVYTKLMEQNPLVDIYTRKPEDYLFDPYFFVHFES